MPHAFHMTCAWLVVALAIRAAALVLPTPAIARAGAILAHLLAHATPRLRVAGLLSHRDNAKPSLHEKGIYMQMFVNKNLHI